MSNRRWAKAEEDRPFHNVGQPCLTSAKAQENFFLQQSHKMPTGKRASPPDNSIILALPAPASTSIHLNSHRSSPRTCSMRSYDFTQAQLHSSTLDPRFPSACTGNLIIITFVRSTCGSYRISPPWGDKRSLQEHVHGTPLQTRQKFPSRIVGPELRPNLKTHVQDMLDMDREPDRREAGVMKSYDDAQDTAGPT